MQLLCEVNETTKLYRMDLRELISKYGDWEENRVKNEKKINEIYNAYESRDVAILTSQFRGVIDNEKCFLLDGHHRKEAIKRLLIKFPNFDENLLGFIIVHHKSGMNNKEIYDLHIKSNLCEPLKPNQIPNEKRTLLINEFKHHRILKFGVSKTPNAKTAYNYKISQNELAELAGEIIIKYPNMEIELILYALNQINSKLSLLFTIDNLKFLSINGKLKKDVLDICSENKFYLNIKDSIYNKDVWINYLDKYNDIEEVLMKIKESQ